ncbi:hypothetical protein JR316_0008936 [Psilocybe cubensis]|uniref:Uncharacterized protein n=2 Tax=Psilocybe cubensis TaxID=181762 RepID=A0ACB8GTC3_PSICU|nr:hypothetical protein JR316_0008936 [Psilocybe cubensis]KAH9478481.1 hypothetical protein JR316_0008936 [Psilocybe cubensis]
MRNIMDNGHPAGLITQLEARWVEIYPFLLQHGYMLRPRYHPNWKPPWNRPWNFFKDLFDFPDFISYQKYNLMDATRISDGARVVMKQVFLEEDNVPLLEYLNSPEMRADPRNNTVPLLEVIPLPSQYEMAKSRESAVLLVMPLLFPLMSWSFPFQHVREIVEAIDQLIKVGPDACFLNYMMDPTNAIPSSFHYARHSLHPDGKSWAVFKDRCLVAPVKYYMIDYETADYFPPNVLSEGRYGQVKTVPEWSLEAPYDPFKLDVYQLGCQVQQFSKEYTGLDFLEPLYAAMTHPSPDMRPTAAESLQQFERLINSLDPESLSSEIWIKRFDSHMLMAQKIAMEYSPSHKKRQLFALGKKKLSKIFNAVNVLS